VKQSAGILLYRLIGKNPEFFLVHPGGPYWKNKDLGAWSIPKGEFSEAEDPLNAAQREYEEETGQKIDGKFIKLNPVKLKSGKMVYAWAIEKDIDPKVLLSNTIEIEWPPKSGKKIEIPEVDKGEWFSFDVAKEKINAAQVDLLNQVQNNLC
jgi:predicted NUDIX family NTP pyrophosphohydrolase